MHEVSLRSSTNLMDAHNLAIVLCPNLISGASPARDIVICSLPGGPALHPDLSADSHTPPSRATLGMIIKLCIQRYFEIFDEVQDRSEALPPARVFAENDVTSVGSSSPRVAEAHLRNASNRPPSLSHNSSNRDSRGFDDDESIDDTMLIMSVDTVPGAPPSAWGSTVGGSGTSRARPRSERQGSNSQRFSSVQAGDTGFGQAYRARSTNSAEKRSSTTRSKGSLTIGRATVRKATGAGVEATGITASGFFAPPVPPLPSSGGESAGG